MPLSPLECEVNSVTRWLSDTFTGAEILMSTVPQGFARPAFHIEMPRTLYPDALPGAKRRQVSVPVVYFGRLDAPWTPVAVAGRLEQALAAVRHNIPRRDEAGAQVGLLVVELEAAARSGTDTDLTITIRYKRLIFDRQTELEGSTITSINYRKV